MMVQCGKWWKTGGTNHLFPSLVASKRTIGSWKHLEILSAFKLFDKIPVENHCSILDMIKKHYYTCQKWILIIIDDDTTHDCFWCDSARQRKTKNVISLWVLRDMCCYWKPKRVRLLDVD
jgi:hypothetical protein